MTRVSCQRCGDLLDHRAAVFYGPPSPLTWVCRDCDKKELNLAAKQPPRPAEPQGPLSAMLDNSPRGASATIPAPMLQPTYIPVERSIRTGSAEDLHKLRFELAHVVQHFKRVGVPEELREWHQRSVQYLRATNPGKAWDVEE